MKKSLILSIVMTLVLVISMSTATFAWYTANDTVTANTAQVTASTAAGNLKISKTGADDSWSTTITFDAPATATVPMMPTDADLTAFATATKNADNTITYSEGASVQTYTFYLSNVNSDELVLDFTVTPTDGTSTSSLRYAILQGSTIYEAKAFNYLTATDDGVTADAVASAEAINKNYTIATNAASVAFTVLLWHDGASMVNAEGGKTSSISISIGKAA